MVSSAVRSVLTLLALGAVLLALGGCGEESADAPGSSSSSQQDSGGGDSDQRHPDVVGVEVSAAEDGTFAFEVTISSPYDSPERYADGWRVLGPDGTVLGEHELTHDHAGEQPFTRTQTGVEIPDGVERVTVEGRDQEFGYGGGTEEVAVPGR